MKALGTGAGTTLAVVEIAHDSARPYHVGDSVIFIVGARGKIKLETVSHSPVGLGLEAGLLDQTEATNHAERHVVLNVIGSDSMRIEVGSTIKLAQRDTVVLASDGLTDNLANLEIVEAVRKGELSVALSQLVQGSRHRMVDCPESGKPDDLTIVLFRRGPAKSNGGTGHSFARGEERGTAR